MAVIRWWVVANPKQWKWDQLFETGQIRFRLGRLARNFARLRVGDTVVGYESSPSHRLAALAIVSKPFGVHDEHGEPSFELMPVLRLSKGLSYADMCADLLLAASEPVRNLNRGILFAVSEAESDHLLRLLATSDDAVADWLSATPPPVV